VSGRSRSCLISVGMLGVMTGAARCPSEEMFDERRALRSSVTLGESSLPSQTISWEASEGEVVTYDSGMRRWLQLKIESDERYWEASNRDSSVASWASGETCFLSWCGCKVMPPGSVIFIRMVIEQASGARLEI
jgi:hypothetical protein